MLNARTWHRLCISAYMAFPGIVMVGLLPKDSPLIWPAIVAIIFGGLVAALGALQGIMLACGKLHMGCPLCNERGFVSGGDGDGIYLECPRCGKLRLKIGRIDAWRAIRRGSVDDDLAKCPPSPGSPLLAPKRHFVPFIIIFLPVVASVVAASVIHEFSFFYILIPGFWCYAVGGFILDGIFSGSVGDNSGTAVRQRSPIRFWGKIGLWSLFYIFAAAFPIGFAIQESGKQNTTSEQTAPTEAAGVTPPGSALK